MNAKKTLAMEHRSSLPESVSSSILFQVLDHLDAQIVIFDSEYRIRYFNSDYFLAYGPGFLKNGIAPEEIINQKLSDLKGNARDFVLNSIKSRTKHEKEFYIETDTNYSGLADLIPIETEDFIGTAVIQQQNQRLEDMHNQLNHYKKLVQKLEKETDEKSQLPPHFQAIIGNSSSFIKTLRTGAQVAKTSGSVCILGESGSGKEVMAEAIHYSSPYAEGPFIKVNCASIPESLMESELFGYEKGAFTGANTKGSVGKLEAANHGTLFLDELGEMPKSMQVKLLRALQEREITRVGGTKPIKLNFRLITATNRNLEQMVEDGEFREDLYYRVCIIPIHLPPLRERRSDIPLLATHFLSNMNQSEGHHRHFTEDVLEHFFNYNWPGNIRELKNCVERMAILCPDEEITSEYLPANIKKADKISMVSESNQYNLKDILDQAEYETFRVVLELANGNKTKAIKMLGISKRSFYMKLEKYGLR